jgi:hypothetical protein
MQSHFGDAEINAKAVELGLIQPGAELPRSQRSKVMAALVQQAAARAARRERPQPQLAKEIVIQPNGVILVDGEPFPWLVDRQPLDIHLDPDGFSTVRMTLLADAVQIIKPQPREESE